MLQGLSIKNYHLWLNEIDPAKIHLNPGLNNYLEKMFFPIPNPKGMEIDNYELRYFAFLQTKMKTGIPIDIQIDVEATTNRESYVQTNNSLWNKRMMANEKDRLANLFMIYKKIPYINGDNNGL